MSCAGPSVTGRHGGQPGGAGDLPAPETVLAVDFGLKHIGLAVGQTITRTASPLTTVSAKDGRPNWGAFDAVVGQWRPDRLVVGLPSHMDGAESEMSRRARQFARILEKRYARPVQLIDERLTSVEAKRLAADGDNHAIAAGLIAETWLNSHWLAPG